MFVYFVSVLDIGLEKLRRIVLVSKNIYIILQEHFLFMPILIIDQVDSNFRLVCFAIAMCDHFNICESNRYLCAIYFNQFITIETRTKMNKREKKLWPNRSIYTENISALFDSLYELLLKISDKV